MSFFKKFLFLNIITTVFVVPAVIADASTVAQTPSNQYFYVEGNLGYARQNYFDNENYRQPIAQPGPGTNYNNNNNATGGFAGGLDVGYDFNQYVGMELGWYHLPSVNVMQAGVAPAYLKSWATYFATKLMMPIPVMHDTDAFIKAGVAYRYATLPGASTSSTYPLSGYNVSSTTSRFIRPMFAAGLDYHFHTNWVGNLQYMYFMGANNSFPFATPNSGAMGTVADNLFTAGLGYDFAG